MFVVSYQPENDAMEYFGPFETWDDAKKWMDKNYAVKLDVYKNRSGLDTTEFVHWNEGGGARIDGCGEWNIGELKAVK